LHKILGKDTQPNTCGGCSGKGGKGKMRTMRGILYLIYTTPSMGDGGNNECGGGSIEKDNDLRGKGGGDFHLGGKGETKVSIRWV